MLLITDIRQIVQVTHDPGAKFLAGTDANNIKVLSDENCSLAILIAEDGTIFKIGHYDEFSSCSFSKKISANNGVVIPGLVDGHSHPVFAGDRVHEFAMKLAGATYLEVQAAGGGIHFTTNATRNATEQELYQDFKTIAKQMSAAGTTTLEAKSGYGLDKDTELKMLRVIDRVNNDLKEIEISGTYCGAHAIPKNVNEDDQTNLVIKVLDDIVKEKQNNKLRCVENIDVFCEKGNFSVESTKQILVAGEAAGLHANFHAEELSCLHSAELGADLKVRAMSHLEEISDEGIKKMATAETVAVLLPTTAFLLRLQPPPARQMIEHGVIVALGSDFNPNSWCFAMPSVMYLACIQLKLSLPEALAAATINAAHSLGRGGTHGALHQGRVADIVVLNVPKWEHLIYRFAAHNTIISYVIKNGEIVYQNTSA